MEIKDLITSRICDNTVFENSWIWYCDECRQHGTGISSDEVNFLAKAHWDYHSYTVLDYVDERAEPSDEEDNKSYLSYMNADPLERDIEVWENDECQLYIIDEGNNITYNYGDNYDDKTPNNVTDLDVMIAVQKQMGLK